MLGNVRIVPWLTVNCIGADAEPAKLPLDAKVAVILSVPIGRLMPVVTTDAFGLTLGTNVAVVACCVALPVVV